VIRMIRNISEVGFTVNDMTEHFLTCVCFDKRKSILYRKICIKLSAHSLYLVVDGLNKKKYSH
jgi:hypothetical protein